MGMNALGEGVERVFDLSGAAGNAGVDVLGLVVDLWGLGSSRRRCDGSAGGGGLLWRVRCCERVDGDGDTLRGVRGEALDLERGALGPGVAESL